jgi:hypothetical protein
MRRRRKIVPGCLWLWRHRNFGLPRPGERLDGDRLYARHRHSVATDELWRIVYRFCFFGFGPGDERPNAAFRQLRPGLNLV